MNLEITRRRKYAAVSMDVAPLRLTREGQQLMGLAVTAALAPGSKLVYSGFGFRHDAVPLKHVDGLERRLRRIVEAHTRDPELDLSATALSPHESRLLSFWGPLDGAELTGDCPGCRSTRTVKPLTAGRWASVEHHERGCVSYLIDQAGELAAATGEAQP